ncbi:hypothetical protein MTO96_018165 [Rhipicephalus appendiculatus]
MRYAHQGPPTPPRTRVRRRPPASAVRRSRKLAESIRDIGSAAGSEREQKEQRRKGTPYATRRGREVGSAEAEGGFRRGLLRGRQERARETREARKHATLGFPYA